MIKALWFCIRWSLRLFVVLVLVVLILGIYIARDALYKRFVTFPRVEASLETIRAQREDVSLDDGWTEYRGVCHSHSHISHDCMVTFPAILEACKVADLDFIFMTDHNVDGKADFSWAWRGDHDGVIFGPGFELQHGFMVWGLPTETVLDVTIDADLLAQEIASKGGLLFYAHSEEDRNWELPELMGMEIYNIHTDLKDEGKDAMTKLLPDMILNAGTYPDQCLRLVYDRQTDILAHWDELNTKRDIVGIAANDAHQNNGIRIRYADSDSISVSETSDKNKKVYALNFLTRPVAALLFGAPEKDKVVFEWHMDPYERSLRFVSNHVLAKEKTEKAIQESLKQGRLFIAFDMLADARGFVFLAQGVNTSAVMGERISLQDAPVLRAESPLVGRFTLLRDGVQLEQTTGRTFAYEPSEAGKYRIEVELDIAGEWVPWIYTNPLRVEA